ncbi:ABC transporter permease [Evansella tamaricis]|uniref:ABC transporter permease n=1 Tax=Evansella tamaricis TaxID=2069301 RepID=A0ABS6JFM3_9BACI|nr:ABC transporter permease subunit [Evansella tamaricis]MBU9711128.1 ABC transporter permease [Evansella tamaricis]
MKQWTILFKKEFKESLRNFKWVWIPLVFILLGITQPVTSYYLPEILKNFGGMPEGVIMEFPMPTAPQVLAETLGQFNQIGILVLVLAFMGVVAGERNSGTNIMVLVKPVSYTAYMLSKWAHMTLLAFVSYLSGFLIALYYTYQLIGSVPASDVVSGFVVYTLWLLFVTTIVLLFSTIFKSTAAVAALTLGLSIILSLLSSITPELMQWSPGMLASHSYYLFQTGEANDGLWLSVVSTVLLVVAMLSISVYIFKKKEVATHTS